MAKVLEEVQKRLKQELGLRQAAAAGKLDVVEALLDQHVDVNANGAESGKTALHWAAKKGFTDIINTLLRAGADRTLLDNNNKTPGDLAKESHHILVFLTLHSFLREKNTQGLYTPIPNVPKILSRKKLLDKFCHILSRHTTFVEEYTKNVKQFIQILDTHAKIGAIAQFDPVRQAFTELQKLIEFHVVTTSGFLDVTDPTLLEKSTYVTFLARFSRLGIDGIKYQRTLATLIENVLAQLDLLKTKLTGKQRARFKKCLKILEIIATEEMKTLMKMSESIFIHHDESTDRDKYCQFIDTYFPSDLIDLIATPYEGVHGKYSVNEVNCTIQNKSVLFQKIELYFKDTIEKISPLPLQRKDLTLEGFNIQNHDEKTLSETWRINYEYAFTEKLAFLKTLQDNAIHTVLPQAYQFAAQVRNLDRYFKATQSDSNRSYKEEAQILRQQFLASLDARKTQESSFADAEKRDKKTRKELERRKRANAQAKAHEEARALIFQKRAIEKDQKLQREKKAEAEKLLSLLTEIEDAQLIIELLNGDIKKLSETAFLKIVKKLKISGSEKIPPNLIGVPGNSLTLTLGTFDSSDSSFTMHFCHGGDGAGFVNPATVANLKKMLQSVNITSEMIQQQCAKKSLSKPPSGIN